MGADESVDEVALARAELHALSERSHEHLSELARRVRDTVDRVTVAVERVKQVMAVPAEVAAIARGHPAAAVSAISVLALGAAALGATLAHRPGKRQLALATRRGTSVGLLAVAVFAAGGLLTFALIHQRSFPRVGANRPSG